MTSRFASTLLVLSIVVLAGAAIVSCGSVTGPADGGASGAAGTGAGGTTGTAGTSAAGTTGAAGTSAAGTTGTGRGGASGVGGIGGAPMTCRTDVAADCPAGFTCACGGAGPAGVCTCHRNCSDASMCPDLEPMCGCPSTAGGPRFCVNACFCTCG